MTDQLLTVSEVAKLFAVQPATIREWLKDGTLQGLKIGGGHYWRIPESAVRELAARRYGDDSND